MKNFAKISLITAGIMLAVGIVFCFFSAVVGGRKLVHVIREDEVLDEKIETAVNKVGNALYEITDGAWGYAWNVKKSTELVINGQTQEESSVYADSEKTGIFEKNNKAEFQIPTEGLREWEIDMGAGCIIIEEKEEADGYLDVSVEGIGNCDYKIEGDTLSMEGFKGIVINGNNSENVITVKLPKDYRFKEIDAKIGAGIMNISDISTDSLDGEIGAGELLLNRIDVGEISMEIGAGRMEASEIEARDAELSVNVGECIYKGSITGNLEADCDMGNMELYLRGSENDHNYEIKCDVGNIKLGTYNFAALSAEKTIQNNVSSNFEIECDMGNIEIEFEEK